VVTVVGNDNPGMTRAYSSFRWSAAVVLAALVATPTALAARPSAPPGHSGTTQTKPANPPQSHSAQQNAQGVVQSLAGRTVVVRALDGSTVTVPVGPGTRVLVDGKLSALAAVKPGFVAIVKWQGGPWAQQLEAFDLSPSSGERLAVVKSVSAKGVVVTGANGGTVTIHANVRTRVFLDGKPSTLASIDAGFTLVTTAGATKGGKPAAELVFLRPS
jgi:hypothetical protein